MGTVGIRELRQDASDLIRRVEAGEEITITVSGRPAARLVAAKRYWHTWDEVKDIWETPVDAEAWMADIRSLDEVIDQSVEDPWARAKQRKSEAK